MIKNETRWSEEDQNRVAAMLREGMSAGQIGKRFQITRNAVIGRVGRCKVLSAIGLKGAFGKPRKDGQPPTQHRFFPKKQAQASVISRNKERRVRDPGLPRLIPVAAPPPTPPTPFTCREIPLMDLARGDCRFPVNDAPQGEQHLFCGNPADSGVYCRHHFLRSIGQGTAIERSALRLARRAVAA